MQKTLTCLVGLVLMTWACALLQPGSAPVKGVTPSGAKAQFTRTPEANPATTSSIPASEVPESKTPEPSRMPTATRPSQPIIAAAYPLSYPGASMGLGGVLATSPGRVWVAGIYFGTAFQGWDPNSGTPPPAQIPGIQEWDADSGKILHAIPFPQAIQFWDIKYDGQYLWVLASKKERAFADTLYALRLTDKQVAKEWDLNEGEYGWSPTRLGFSPGKIWVANKVIDTQSLQEEALGESFNLPSEAHFGYDGQRWMWITGSRCAGCNHDLWLFDANDPKKIKDGEGTGAPNESTTGQSIIQANGKMWLGAIKDIKTVNWLFTGTPYLEAYDLNQTDHPSLSVDITKELADGENLALLIADNHVLWLGNQFGSTTLYYHDQNNGQLLGSLLLDTAGLADIAFDGKNLWVLDADDLVRVALPWAP